MVGTSEGEIVDELKGIGGYTLIPKNRPMVFWKKHFKDGCKKTRMSIPSSPGMYKFRISHFAITLKTWFNVQNRKVRVIVPINAVETYDLGLHDGDLMHVMALYNMMINGVELAAGME